MTTLINDHVVKSMHKTVHTASDSLHIEEIRVNPGVLILVEGEAEMNCWNG